MDHVDLIWRKSHEVAPLSHQWKFGVLFYYVVELRRGDAITPMKFCGTVVTANGCEPTTLQGRDFYWVPIEEILPNLT